MKNTRVVFAAAFVGITLFALTAQAATHAEQVCAKKDFMEFIAAFAELTARQQAACVRFPLKVRDREHATQQAFLRSPAAKAKFIASKKDVEQHGKAARVFFAANDGTDPANAEKYVYVVTGQGNTRKVLLTEGGTFVFETGEFLWDGAQWMLVDIR
ncbi:MAG: hypothetical protein FWH34_07635 [Desulfovibrionaceae bacterium]|nr:hypothetical protein [Desulfovibrionaceae bacterium]